MSQAGEPSSFVTRSGLRARSGTPTPVPRPTPIRRRPARGATPVYDDGSDDKPTITTKNSKAYGAATKVAAPKQMDARQALRPAAEALNAAVTNTMKSTAMTDLPEESSGDDDEDEIVESEEMKTTPSSREAHDRSGSQSIRQAIQTSLSSPRAQTTHAWLENTFWAPHAPSILNDVPVEIPVFQVAIPWYRRISACVTSVQHYFMRYMQLACSNYRLYQDKLLSAVKARVRIPTVPEVFLSIISVLCLVVLTDLFVGPILPSRLDPLGLRTFKFQRQETAPSCGPFDPAQYGIGRYTTTDLAHRLEELEAKCKSRLSRTSAQYPAVDLPQINWFEPGQGARVDLRLSSPTAASKLTMFERLFHHVTVNAYRRANRIHVNTPFEALQPWTDGGADRWCAPADRGKMQIAVNIARTIAPTKLIIEHAAKSASIVVGSAPKELEFWVRVDNDDIRESLHETIQRIFPDLRLDSSPQRDKAIEPRTSLGSNFVRVGRWLYDIHSNVVAQEFRIPVDLESLGVSTKKVAVRVNSNWADLAHTCVNRFRLYGTDMSGIVENLEGSNRDMPSL